MPSNVWVKVVGFSDVERHSLNTLFRLSADHDVSYSLWTPEMDIPAHVALIDLDTYESSLEMQSPNFNNNMKFIGVGARKAAKAWDSFSRPVDWKALIHSLDSLFAVKGEVDIDLDAAPQADKPHPPGVKRTLLVGFAPEDHLYLRARLALAHLTDVDIANTVELAGAQVLQRRYDLVIVYARHHHTHAWELAKTLIQSSVLPHTVIVATPDISWHASEHAEHIGCLGVLEMPFNPRQIVAMLQKV